MNKKTRALTEDEYIEIIETLIKGSESFRPNRRIAFALQLEANLGMRISDILTMKLDDIVFEGGRYHLNGKVEKKTKKERIFIVHVEMVEFIRKYAKELKVDDDQYLLMPEVPTDIRGKELDKILLYKERAIQKHLSKVVDYLGYKGNISTHSFRKYAGTDLYNKSDGNIVLVQKFFQHSSPAITQRYIGVTDKDLEQALSKHLSIVAM